MALAKFFHKDALALSQALNSQDIDSLQKTLNSHLISIAFDKKALTRDEGRSLIDLSIRLLARIYPKLQFKDLDGNFSREVEDFKKLAKAINPAIDFVEKQDPTVGLVVGEISYKIDGKPSFYVGSEGWVAKFSNSSPVGIGNTNNPFGAGASACFGAANIFRYVFKEYLDNASLDQSFNFSLRSLKKVEDFPAQKSFSDLDLGELHLIGLGAVGNDALWVFSKINDLEGKVHLIDHEKVALSNLQRYVLCTESDVNSKKVHIGSNYLKQNNLDVFPHHDSWEEYLQQEEKWNLKNLAVCIDSAEDRIKIQGSLPHTIINAYTDVKILGVSRHFNFLEDPCLACGYLPAEEKKSFSVKVAESLSLEQHEKMIRGYLYHSKPADKEILNLVAQANGVPYKEISQYKGLLLEEFYSEVVCGVF